MARAKKDAQEAAQTNKYEKITEIEFEGKKISIRYAIPIDDYTTIVHDVFLLSFTESGEYIPEMTSVVMKYYIIKNYTDFAIPSNIKEAYDIIVNTDIYSLVLDAVNMEQIADMYDAVDKRIDKALVVSAEVAERNMASVGEQFRAIGDKLTKMFADFANKGTTEKNESAKPVRKKSSK